MKKIILLGLLCGFLFMPAIAFGVEYTYNISQLPFNTTKEIILGVSQEEVPTIITATYEDWLSGETTIDMNETLKQITIGIDIPSGIVDEWYTRYATFNSTNGTYLRIGFLFNITANLTSAVSNVSITGVQCDYSRSPPVCTFQILSTGQEPRKEIVTIYNTTTVISCADLYAGDYASLSSKYSTTKTNLALQTELYTNISKMLQRGCIDEQQALNVCYSQKTMQESLANAQLPNYCLQQQYDLQECLSNKELLKKQVMPTLNLVPHHWILIAIAFAFLMVLGFSYPLIKKIIEEVML